MRIRANRAIRIITSILTVICFVITPSNTVMAESLAIGNSRTSNAGIGTDATERVGVVDTFGEEIPSGSLGEPLPISSPFLDESDKVRDREKGSVDLAADTLGSSRRNQDTLMMEAAADDRLKAPQGLNTIRFSFEMPDHIYNGKGSKIRIFEVDTNLATGALIEVLGNGTKKESGIYTIYDLPKTPDIDYTGFILVQPDNVKNNYVLGLLGDSNEPFTLLAGEFDNKSFATPDLLDKGADLIFDAILEDSFFEREALEGKGGQTSFLSVTSAALLENTLPLDDSDPIREKVIGGWLDTFDQIPNLENQIKQRYPSSNPSVWDTYRRLGLVAGDREDQLRRIVSLYNLNADQEAVFRDYRILIDDDHGIPFTDTEKSNIRDWLSIYPKDLIYRLGAFTKFDGYGRSGAGSITPHYLNINFSTSSVTNYVFHHELAHGLDGCNPGGLRPALLNQGWMREQMYDTAFFGLFGHLLPPNGGYDEDWIMNMGTAGIDYGQKLPFVTSYSRTDHDEFMADEWAQGVLWNTEERLANLVSNATAPGGGSEVDFASLRHHLTLLNMLAYNSPNQDEVRAYRNSSQVGSFKVDLSCADNPGRGGPECNITRIDAPVITNSGKGNTPFPYKSIRFDYAPLDPKHPNYDLLHIRSITVEYPDGRVETFDNPFVN